MLTEEERETLDASLADSGCMGFLGDHPELYAAVETILARHEAEAERRGAEQVIAAVDAEIARAAKVERAVADTFHRRPGIAHVPIDRLSAALNAARIGEVQP